MKIEELQKVINVIFITIKADRQKNNINGLLNNGIACLEYSYQLIDIMVNFESEYRKFEADLIDKGFTSAKAETQAKATDHYKNWTKCKYMYDTLLEMNLTCKKLASSTEKEFNSI